MTFIVYIILCAWPVCGQVMRSELFDEQLYKATELFSGLERVKSYFRNNTNPLAKSILDTFENECLYMKEPKLPAGKGRKPFIVIEGNHKNSREVVGLRLATLLDARYLVHPAPCLIRYLDVIPKGTLIRRAYYVLSLYAVSFNVKIHLSVGRAVVLNGYWLDQMSFALVQSFPKSDLPPITSDMFEGPKGLLQPDLLFYLNLPDDLFYKQITTRSPLNWKKRVLELYQGLTSRHPIVIQDLMSVFRLTTDVVYQQIHHKLSDQRDIYSQKPMVNVDSNTQPYGETQPFGRHQPSRETQPYGRQQPYRETQPYGKQQPYEETQPYGRQQPYRETQPYDRQQPYRETQPYGRQQYPSKFEMHSEKQNESHVELH